MLSLKKIKKIYQVFSITGKYLKLACDSKNNIADMKNGWSKEILCLFNIELQVVNPPVVDNGSPYLFVGNHVSYLDIPIILNSTPDISFVSKSEVKSWPVVGKAAEKGGTIFVQRGNAESRGNAKLQIGRSLIENNQKVIIFPSGTTSLRTSHSWKKGAFEIAEKNNIKICPFRIKYNPLSAAAYVGDDNFVLHMYQLFSLKKIRVTLEFHEPVLVTNSVQDCMYWKNWCEQ